MRSRFEPWDTIWETHETFIREGLTFEQALTRIKDLVTSKDGAKIFGKGETDWALIENADYTADKKTIAEWFTSALNALAKQPESRVIHTELGDCPEVFAPMLAQYNEINPEDVDETYYDEVLEVPFGDYIDDHRNNELKAPMFEFLVGVKKAIPMNVGYIIWLTFANLAIAELFAKADLSEYLGAREAVYLTFGFEEAMTYGGALTPDGWRYLEFIAVHRLKS